jgi:hypothetical protein
MPMSPKEREIIIERFETWFRDSLIKSHRKNTVKLKNIKEFQINPFLLYYLANYLEGNSDPETLAKVLVYPRVLGTSITTSFGTRMQGEFITKVLGAYGSAIPGIDIEFNDQVDGRRKYCQLKSGPNALNHDDVKSVRDHFRGLLNRGRVNISTARREDLIFCLTYGEPDEKNSFVQELESDFIVYIGREFWIHFTGDKEFYGKLITAAGNVAKNVNMKDVVEDVIKDLSHTIEDRFDDIIS